DETARAGLFGKAGGLQLRTGETLLPQVLDEHVPPLGGVPAAVALRRLPVEPALRQEFPGRPGARCGELARVERGRLGVRRDQPLLLPLLPDRRRPSLHVAQLDTGLASQPLDGLDEAQMFGLHDEPDRVATRPAAVAEIDVTR